MSTNNYSARLIAVLLGVFLGLIFVSRSVLAYCEDSTGQRYDVLCNTDSQCQQDTVVIGGVGERICMVGIICQLNVAAPVGARMAPGFNNALPASEKGVCVSSLGYINIARNKIVGGYSLTGTGLRDLINNVTLAVGVVVGLIFFVMLILGGIAYMMSSGDEKQLTKAKQQITAGLIGLVIVFMAWWVVKIISVIFGINILQPSFTGP
ncbi:pilin [Candidatus Parcubacteria bacterium]|nr:pilin [Patescibacteria group bacterium]MBU4380657.1 pilin [Patescibacteria group bacterium]MCG2689574.1 pilin [Candidatus Parcubacteria bacterium]